MSSPKQRDVDKKKRRSSSLAATELASVKEAMEAMRYQHRLDLQAARDTALEQGRLDALGSIVTTAQAIDSVESLGKGPADERFNANNNNSEESEETQYGSSEQIIPFIVSHMPPPNTEENTEESIPVSFIKEKENEADFIFRTPSAPKNHRQSLREATLVSPSSPATPEDVLSITTQETCLPGRPSNFEHMRQ